MWSNGLALVLLSALTHTVRCNDGKYLFLLPKTVRPGVDYIISGQNFGTDPINVTTTLEDTYGTVLATSYDVLVTTKRIMISPPSVMVKVSRYSSQPFRIRMRGSGGASFTRYKSLYFSQTNMEVIIQTDKKVYKPGQTVKYRIFAINPDVTTYTGNFSVEIEDPRQNKIEQYNRAGDMYGVLQDELKLTSEPVYGDWKITVKRGEVSQISKFSIDRYVLPRAEAKVSIPSYITLQDSNVKVKVTGKYTHGKPLSGSGVLRLKVDYFSIRYKYVKDNATNRYIRIPTTSQPVLLYNLTLVNGEASVTPTLQELKDIAYSGSLSHKTLKAQVNITDDETQTIYQSKEVSSSFHTRREKIKFAMSPQNFKPGVTNSYYIEVLDHDGKPLTGETGSVTITGRYKYQNPETTTTSTTTSSPPSYPTGAPMTSPTPPPPDYSYWWINGGNRPRCTPPTYSYVDITPQTHPLPIGGLLKIDIKIDDPEAIQLSLTATYNNISSLRAYAYLEATRSPSNTFLSIQLLTLNPKVNDYAEFQVTSSVEISSFYYIALAKGQIQYSSRQGYYTASKSQKFKLRILPNFAPTVRILVYFKTTNREIVADAITFSVDGVFKNEVSIEFDKTKAEPADPTKLSVKAAAYSNVYALAVDKSTTLIGGAVGDMEEEVLDFMAGLDPGSIPSYGNWYHIPWRRKKRSTQRSTRRKRSPYYYYPIFTPGTDVDEILKYNGIQVITDTLIYNYVKEPDCPYYPYYPGFPVPGTSGPLPPPGTMPTAPPPGTTAAAPPPAGMSPTAPPPPGVGGSEPEPWEDEIKERSFFPETWVWDSKMAQYDGYANFSLTVPDTITSWVASAFAIHPSSFYGVGFTDNLATLEVYHDFFVTLNLPYSVIRGEEVLIQAIVFNYLSVDVDAIVTLKDPKGFVILKLDDKGFFSESQEEESRTVKVKKDKTASVYFAIKAVDLGSLDIQVFAKSIDQQAGDLLTKPLLVEPEGIQSEYAETMLIDLRQPTVEPVEQFFTLTFPSNYIAGSRRVVITAYGDMMAGPLNNLDHLVRMPYGCGEQNMVKFVPNIFVRKYLDAIGALTPDIKSKTDRFMKAGYLGELRYRRKDGSFSGFGDRDKYGSQWLTAYVVHSYISAKPYIYVDDNIIKQAVTFMMGNQNYNGTFREQRRSSSSYFGDSTRGLALTAFTVISLADADTIPGVYVSASISRAVNALSTASTNMTNIHDLAITAYAFVRAKAAPFLDTLLPKIEALKTTEGAFVFWEVKSSITRYYYWYPRYKRYNSATIEATAYMLLVYAHQKDLVKGLPVMNWLLKQSNGNGGYRSTRDTIVALHALSEFAPLVYSTNLDLSLTISACRDVHNWRITKPTAMIQRKAVLKETSEKVSIKATGEGRAIVSALVKYNVEDVDAKTALSVRVQVVEETLNKLRLQICTEYTVPGSSSSMAIMEVGIISGFTLDSENLAAQTEIKRYETDFRKAVLYFDQISNNATCVDINLKRQDKVGKVKPAFVKVYDYYNPDDSVSVFYTAVKASTMEVCESCVDSCDICNEATRRRRRR